MDIYDAFRVILFWFFDWQHIWLLIVFAVFCVAAWFGQRDVNRHSGGRQ